MNNNQNRALTYSVLAYIRNNNDFIDGPLDIFVPLIKRTLSELNSKGIFKGKNISELKEIADKEYSIDFPIPVLSSILHKIASEVNTDEKTSLVINNDLSFEVLKYTFHDYDDLIASRNEEILRLENLFGEFKETIENNKESDTIFKFIEKNKFTLSKYLSENNDLNGQDYSIEAQFVNFFRSSKPIYDLIKEIYLGSILTSYIEYQPKEVKHEVELLLDTNFVVGLLDLNTPESTHTCRTLIKIAKESGYRISILKATIEETENLLKGKSHNFDKSFLQKKVNPEDVYNACERRNLTKVDLERISDNIEKELSKYQINIYHNHENITRDAKHSSEFTFFKGLRGSEVSALHDATAIMYVKRKRGYNIYEFEKVNCWFVNNSTSYFVENLRLKGKQQPETIKADDLLNILWLSNPVVNREIDTSELVNIGLTSTISLALNKNLPKSKVLKELDENICKYAQDEISDADIVKIATRITNKQLTNLEELNQLANDENKEQFITRLQNEAEEQKKTEKEQLRKIDLVFRQIKSQNDQVIELKNTYKKKLSEIDGKEIETETNKTELIAAKDKINEQNETIKNMRIDKYLTLEVEKWRKRALYRFIFSVLVLLGLILYAFFKNDFELEKTITFYYENKLMSIIVGLVVFCINGWFLKSLYDRYENNSNIENFKKGIEIPHNI